MILIAGESVTDSSLFALDGLEETIFERLSDDPETYTYQSPEELKFEIAMRNNIVASASLMSQGDSRFETFAGTQSNPAYWHITDTGGMQIRKDVKPSDAISDIFINSQEYAFECATAKVILYYHAILKTAGEEFFNHYFQDLYLYSWHFDSDLVMQSTDTYHFIPGDVVYFNNPDFNPMTFWWRGENAVVMGDGKFFGHGLGIEDADYIIEFLNGTRKPDSSKPAYLTDYVARPSFNHLAKLYFSQRIHGRGKYRHRIIFHNKDSISCDRYLYYLYRDYLQK
ncbi:protein-glutamine gamma-glutamyltransferase [Sutcliffiella horikoshii]|uniref:protein-glutamine gamma-glutamyltransferase n=1 Tax=Sutcliffiella horikoshii TaxID=79883 RepID=UPI002042056C|nr:protein-glutamine gamma-glutamyltransferase [Sutcliffiella horikoshii]MCM3617221.1 protein-glutamine gamma-glutamyltransferase [Sutcliffiella horikoshii]